MLSRGGLILGSGCLMVARLRGCDCGFWGLEKTRNLVASTTRSYSNLFPKTLPCFKASNPIAFLKLS